MLMFLVTLTFDLYSTCCHTQYAYSTGVTHARTHARTQARTHARTLSHAHTHTHTANSIMKHWLHHLNQLSTRVVLTTYLSIYHQLSCREIQVFSKGLNFVPTPKILKEDIANSTQQMCRKFKLQEYFRYL